LALMNLLKTELNTVLEHLTPLVDSSASRQRILQAEPLDAKKLREILEKLEPLLEDGNPECLNFIDSLRLMPESEELIFLMEDMEFERASATLAELKKRVFIDG